LSGNEKKLYPTIRLRMTKCYTKFISGIKKHAINRKVQLMKT